MIATSAAYKAGIGAARQSWSAKAVIDYTDYNLDNSIATIVTESDRLSRDDQLADGIEVTTWKFFPSWNRFEWGKGYRLRAETETENERGALSYQLSDADGNFPQVTSSFSGFTMASTETMASDFTDYPRFAITFSPRTISSLRVAFDDMLGEWAEDFDVEIYKSGVLDTTVNVTGNSSYLWTQDITEVLQATKVEVVVKSWNYARSKAKVVESFTSIQETYNVSDIIEMSVAEESEPDDSTIPIGNVTANTCAVSLINEIMSNGKSVFDNDNDMSVLAGNIIKNRRVRLYSLFEGDEIPLGTFYTNKWKIRPLDLSAEASGQDLIALMDDQEYTENQFIKPQTGVISEDYDTNSEFSAFTLDNVVVDGDSIKMGGAALACDDVDTTSTFAGFTMASTETMSSGTYYCGTAEQTISYTYTPGSSVKLTMSYTGSAPVGTDVELYVSYKSTDEFNLVDGSFVFTPEDITNSSQTVKIRALLKSQSTEDTPTITSITVDADELVTLYSVAAKVIEDFDDGTGLVEGNYTIDQQFGDVEIPNAYLQPQSFREVLRKVVEAGAGRAYVTRTGAIKIESFQSLGAAVKAYDKSTYFDIEKPVNPQSLYNRVTVVTNPLTKAGSAEEIASVTIEPGTDQDLTVEYDEAPAEFDSFGSATGVTVNSSTAYTWGVVFNVDNTSGSEQSLAINGFPYRVTGRKRVSLDNTTSTRKNGVIEYLIDDNPLIQTEAQANDITSIMINSLSQNRRQAQIDAVPDPSIEVSDTVTIDGNGYIINSQEIEFAGGQMTHTIGGKS